jgi:hypothetical protein
MKKKYEMIDRDCIYVDEFDIESYEDFKNPALVNNEPIMSKEYNLTNRNSLFVDEFELI